MTISQIIIRFVICAALSLPVSLLADADQPGPEIPDPEIIQNNRYGEFLVAADVDWSRYQKVNIDRATVEFRKNWVRDQRQRSGNTIREKDQILIKSKLADLLNDVLTSELSEKGGYIVTDSVAADVMRMTPRVLDLDIVAPDRVRDHIGYSLADSQGHMTLELDIYDALSGELLATTSRFEKDPLKGYLEWTTSGTNRTAGRFMLQRWSTWLRDGLDQAAANSMEQPGTYQ
jgi:hypothetical protein